MIRLVLRTLNEQFEAFFAWRLVKLQLVQSERLVFHQLGAVLVGSEVVQSEVFRFNVQHLLDLVRHLVGTEQRGHSWSVQIPSGNFKRGQSNPQVTDWALLKVG